MSILKILEHLYTHMEDEIYGLELSQATSLSNGAMYPALDRLEDASYIEARWEDIDEKAEGRRRRCYYKLTASGITFAAEQLRRSPTLPAMRALGGLS